MSMWGSSLKMPASGSLWFLRPSTRLPTSLSLSEDPIPIEHYTLFPKAEMQLTALQGALREFCGWKSHAEPVDMKRWSKVGRLPKCFIDTTTGQPVECKEWSEEYGRFLMTFGIEGGDLAKRDSWLTKAGFDYVRQLWQTHYELPEGDEMAIDLLEQFLELRSVLVEMVMRRRSLMDDLMDTISNTTRTSLQLIPNLARGYATLQAMHRPLGEPARVFIRQLYKSHVVQLEDEVRHEVLMHPELDDDWQFIRRCDDVAFEKGCMLTYFPELQEEMSKRDVQFVRRLGLIEE